MAHKMYKLSPPGDLALSKLLTRLVQISNNKMTEVELLVSKEMYGSVLRAYFIILENKNIFIE